MIEYQTALRRVVARARLLPSEPVALAEALGRTLSRDIRAPENVPPFDKATMDGYAVRSADTRNPEGAPSIELEVVEDLPAGRVGRKPVGPGQAVRIMTGAPLPKGADAVIMVEDTEKTGPRVRIRRGVRPGENIGRAGEDLGRGEVVLEKGRLIGPAELGALASVGSAAVPVIRSPRVAVIATGDEIVEPGEKRARGQIYNSNGQALLAMSRRAGADASYLGIARDKNASLKPRIRMASGADILVLSGGVSVGDHDLVRQELSGLGVRTVFWQVGIKPGKPVFFGTRGRQLVFGLPGNPTSAMVTFLLFVRPAIDCMLGRREIGARHGRAVLSETVVLKPGRTQFLRGVLAGEGPGLLVRPFPDQKSGVLRSMFQSQVLIVVDAEISRIEKGRKVEILFLD